MMVSRLDDPGVVCQPRPLRQLDTWPFGVWEKGQFRCLMEQELQLWILLNLNLMLQLTTNIIFLVLIKYFILKKDL